MTINNEVIRSKKTINVLGVEFDSKLQWDSHVAKAIGKARKSLHAIKLIRRYFTVDELRGLITSNFYSVLYYNSEVWLLLTLKASIKQKLLSASSEALRLCSRMDWTTSFEMLHTINKRATPMSIMKYKHSIELYRLYNSGEEREDWIDLNFQQNFNNRNEFINVIDTSTIRVGKNMLVNRLTILNGQIKHAWMNYSIDTYKVKCKNLFLTSP